LGRRGVNDCGWKPWLIDDFEQKVLTYVTEVDIPRFVGSDKYVASLEVQMVAAREKHADAELRLKRLIDALARGVVQSALDAQINELVGQIETLKSESVGASEKYQYESDRAKSAETRKRDLVELMKVIGDREVRLKLREQLRGFIDEIAVDLHAKDFIVMFAGPVPVKSRMVDANNQSTVMENYEW
jgi:hypothetical protein